MSPVTCTVCNKKLSCKRSLKRHKQTLHKNHSTISTYDCNDCGLKFQSLTGLNTHMDVQHRTTTHRFCLYCQKSFTNALAYTEHLNDEHGLPDTSLDLEQADTNSGLEPTKTSFGGALKIYDVKIAANEVDLLSLMQIKRTEVNNIIRINTQLSPQRVQLGAVIGLYKPGPELDFGSQPEIMTLYVNSKMKPVDFDGLSDNQYYEMTEQMLLNLNNFSSQGSGWTVSNVRNLQVRLAKSRSVRAGSFLKLPSKLQGSRHILNIRNNKDEKCFLYCFTAQYHRLFGPSLIPDTGNWRQKTNPFYYGSENPKARLPIGEYDMPMGINQIDQFETLNNVRVNIFR